MRTHVHLIFTRLGAARMTIKAPKLAPGEVVVGVDVEIDEAFFKRPQLNAKVIVPASSASPLTIESETIATVKDSIERDTGFKVEVSIKEEE